MKRRHVGLMMAILSVFWIFFHIPHAASADEQTGDRYIVSFEEKIDYELLEESGADIEYKFELIPTVAATLNKEALEKMKTSPTVKRINKDVKIKVQSNEQVATVPYKQVLAHEAKQAGWTGKGVKVGVIDSGINGKHPDLQLAGGFSALKDQPYDEDSLGHGTHVAGVIAALDNGIGIIGVAPNVQLYSIKVLDSYGRGTQSGIMQGVEWAVRNNLDVINLSLTTTHKNKDMEDLFQAAYEKGLLIVAAAGNREKEGESFDDVLYPARFPSVIAVCSLNEQRKLSSFSYYGPSLEICAIGKQVYSTFPNEDGYSYESGTSVASAFVTGALALYKQAYPDMTNKQIRKVMQNNALPLGDTLVKSNLYGYGLVQAPGKILTSYTDVKVASWYIREINFLTGEAIVTGYPDKIFKPEESITRAEAVTILARALNLTEETGESFADVKANHYAKGYINAAVKSGIIEGFPDKTFKPDELIKRADVAVMFKRAFQYTDGSEANFSDVQSGIYYYPAVSALVREKIAGGYDDRTFRPDRPIKRGEYAVFAARALNEEFKIK